MKLIKKLAAGVLAGALALSMTACSSVDMNQLVNAKLAASSSSYTVQDFDVNTDTVALIQKAEDTYTTYLNALTNTDDLADELDDEGYSSSNGRYQSLMSIAKENNRIAKQNFESALDALNKDGLTEVYTIQWDDIGGDVADTDLVAQYVASLLTGNAKVYISDVVNIPVLDSSDGDYTGASSALRYVYIEYVD